MYESDDEFSFASAGHAFNQTEWLFAGCFNKCLSLICIQSFRILSLSCSLANGLFEFFTLFWLFLFCAENELLERMSAFDQIKHSCSQIGEHKVSKGLNL